jgi:hypothetical protein
MESIELFGREVLPEFLDRDESACRDKAARLEAIVAAAMARKPDTRRDLGDYSFPAIPRQWADAAGSEEMRAWLDRFADDRAAGKRDAELGIAG